MSLRAVFFGTPEFAVPSLDRVAESGTRVAIVVTQPDRPVGRHSEARPSAIAAAAARRGLPVAKPERLKGNAALLDELRATAPDVGIVVAYGRLLPDEILEVPRLGFVNVHASLLPKYRGASPIQAALIAGERETGVVTMRVAKELDSGPIYLERRVSIHDREDAGSLSQRLASIGAELLVETLVALETGTAAARPQEGVPSFCKPLRREDGEIDWSRPAAEITRGLRAFTPWPGLYTFWGDERLKILEIDRGPATERPPGSLWREDGRLLVAAGEGTSLEIQRVQRAGRRAMTAEEFAKGLRGSEAHLGRK
jgi:methionyl-tRNA formyltransferase